MESKLIKNIFSGVFISFVCTIIFLLIYSILLTYTNIGENSMNVVITIITAISILIGSSIGNLKIKKNGLINGGIIGGTYLIIIYLISSILNWRFDLSIEAIILIVTGIGFGILGGIIGVNKK
ncbi:MAG: TIGR04086 family membrane protein [Clostridia bacterium]|nr:TIGR04086 family membrane protein [Clostridia bacterium]